MSGAGLQKSDAIYPATVADEAIDGGTPWQNPDNAKADDGNYATCAGEKSDWLNVTDFTGGTNSIPTSVRIVGIELVFHCGLDGITDKELYMLYKGFREGQNQAHDVEWYNSYQWRTHGSPFSVWGISPTIWALQDPDFGFSYRCTAKNGKVAYIDSIAMKVYYLNNELGDVQICNQALAIIGEPGINSFDDDNARARTCKSLYDTVRQNLLSQYPWRSATVRTELMRNHTPPPFGWNYAYSLPINLVRLLKVNFYGAYEDPHLGYIPHEYPTVFEQLGIQSYPHHASWQLAGGNVIYTNQPVADIEYVADYGDPTQFSFPFRDALAWELATYLQPILANNPAVQVKLVEAAAAKKAQAFQADMAQGYRVKRGFTWL